MRRRDLITAIGVLALPGFAGLSSARESNTETEETMPATESGRDATAAGSATDSTLSSLEAGHPDRHSHHRFRAHRRLPGDGTYTAVVDRFEGALAVLLLEEHGDTVGEISLATWQLPRAARHVDAILTVRVENGVVVDTTYEEGVTAGRAERAQSRFDSLSRRPHSDDDSESNSGSESE